MELILAEKEQIDIITEISKAAFDTDVEVGAGKAGGPPDYDSVEWHRKMQEGGNLCNISDWIHRFGMSGQTPFIESAVIGKRIEIIVLFIMRRSGSNLIME